MKRHFIVLALLTFVGYCRAQFSAQPDFPVTPLADSTVAKNPFNNISVAIKDNYKVVLKWQLLPVGEEGFFAVERSDNGIDFNAISLIKSTTGGWFDFIDDAAPKGKMYYRIKFSGNNTVYYSTIVNANPSGDLLCKFYPNPVDKMLIVRSEMPVDIQIADKFGKPVLYNRLPAGLKVVDVSSLEAGVYIISLLRKDGSLLLSEKLIKK